MSDSLQRHEQLHTRPPWPSPSPGVCSNLCQLSWWCHPTSSSSVTPFSCPPSFPASWSFPVSWLFASGGRCTGASASASVFSVNIQGWFPLGLTDLISLQSKAVDCVDHNKLWKIFRDRNTRPLHLPPEKPICRSRSNRTGRGTIDRFQIRKRVHQGCILSPCLFNLHAEYVMQNAGLDESQAEIKIADRNINNLPAYQADEQSKQSLRTCSSSPQQHTEFNQSPKHHQRWNAVYFTNHVGEKKHCQSVP